MSIFSTIEVLPRCFCGSQAGKGARTRSSSLTLQKWCVILAARLVYTASSNCLVHQHTDQSKNSYARYKNLICCWLDLSGGVSVSVFLNNAWLPVTNPRINPSSRCWLTIPTSQSTILESWPGFRLPAHGSNPRYAAPGDNALVDCTCPSAAFNPW